MSGQRAIKTLVIDDDMATRHFLREALSLSNHEVEVAKNGREGLASLQNQRYDLVITDLRMPGVGGMELIKTTRDIMPEARVVMVSGFGTVDTAVEAMQVGASDFISKPITLEKLDGVLTKLLDTEDGLDEKAPEAGSAEDSTPQPEADSQPGQWGMIGESESMAQVTEEIRCTAATDVTVLITGESGTGKELVARAIHTESARRSEKFVAVNCGAIAENLLVRELFGHEAQSFTGATETKVGLFEEADGGTIFLDEIGDTSNEFQRSLLRVLQEGELIRVGGVRPHKIDVRVIAATNKDLKKEMEEGRFRDDLYYRLNVVSIAMPPLRDRREDIPSLINHFLCKLTPPSEQVRFDRSALEQMLTYDWPGNIRELQNAVQRAVVMGRTNPLTADALPPEVRSASFSGPVPVRHCADKILTLKEAKAQFEREYIKSILAQAEGNVSKAARVAAVGRPYLHEKMRKYHIGGDEFRPARSA